MLDEAAVPEEALRFLVLHLVRVRARVKARVRARVRVMVRVTARRGQSGCDGNPHTNP